jgi:CubicO group peptidase (beta-lactamase class C family)
MLIRAAKDVLFEHCDSDLAFVRSAHYSDLGYLIAGAVLERRTGKALDSAVWDSLLRHLSASVGSSRQWLASSMDFKNIVAPTEFVGWRGGTLRGIVHDENAWAWAGHGIAGHAGLFATATGVAQFGASVLDSLAGRYSSVARFAAHFCTAIRDKGTLRAGFDGIAIKNSSAGRLISRRSFGHLGFTGTSLWCDPERDLVVVVLSNRVCPTRRNVRLPLARAEIHDQLIQWAAKRRDA